jgi:excisionase family DNA binding protein
VASHQNLPIYSPQRNCFSIALGVSRPLSAARAHLCCMDTATSHQPGIEAAAEDGLGPVFTTSQLAAHLGVSVQTLYDLRNQGRGPRGFRVGREMRFRLCEVHAWLQRMEEADADRHPGDDR